MTFPMVLLLGPSGRALLWPESHQRLRRPALCSVWGQKVTFILFHLDPEAAVCDSPENSPVCFLCFTLRNTLTSTDAGKSAMLVDYFSVSSLCLQQCASCCPGIISPSQEACGIWRWRWGLRISFFFLFYLLFKKKKVLEVSLPSDASIKMSPKCVGSGSNAYYYHSILSQGQNLHWLNNASAEIYRVETEQGASLVNQMFKNLPAMQETQVWSLNQEDALKKGMAAHSRILAWRILWREAPGGLQSMGLQRVRTRLRN